MLTYADECVQHRLLHLNAPEYVTAMAKAMDVGMPRYSLYLPYWYQSTNTDAAAMDIGMPRYSLYLLYWYRSTNTDAAGARIS